MSDEPSATNRRCPSCGRQLAENAVLCIHCGYHLEKGMRLPAASDPTVKTFPVDANPNPYRAPVAQSAAQAAPRPILRSVLSVFWISGRIPRWQWWAHTLGWSAATFTLMIVDTLIFNHLNYQTPPEVLSLSVFTFQWLIITAQVRRWHDMDKSGLWYFINVIPIIGPFYTLVECGFEPGDSGPNDYGEDPLAPA